jgi:hypothetical protein
MSAAEVIAAARATGSVVLGAEQLTLVQATCARVGRRAIPVGEAKVAVGYEEGYGPNLDDGAITVYELPPTRLVALALCLTLCHDGAHGPPFGHKATLAQFDAALTKLRLDRDRTAIRETPLVNAHVKGALFELDEMGYVRLQADTIEIGPALAGWSNADWALIDELREAQLKVET